MSKQFRYGARIALSVDVKSGTEVTGSWEGYALANEHNHDLQCVVLNDMTVVTRNHPDPDIASAAKHLIPEAHKMNTLILLQEAWESDYRARHGEGARADYEYERRQA